MRKILFVIALTLLAAIAAGCATKRQTGAVAGAAAGTAVGAAVGETKGAVIGGLVGAVVGSEVGRYMDRRDREATYDALEYTRTGERAEWINPDTGRRYYVTPRDTFAYRGQEPCREFDIVTQEGGREFRSTEIACRRSDGSWVIQG